MARQMIINFPQADTGYLYPLSVAGGAATSSITLAMPYPVIFEGVARKLTLSSTDNLSGVNFTFTGFDQYFQPISEILAGPNNNTVVTANDYHVLSNIAADGGYTNFSAGIGSTGIIRWIPMNYQIDPVYYNIQTTVTGTINYSLYQTLDPIGFYRTSASQSEFILPKTSPFLATNPITTVNGSGVVTVTLPSTGGLVNDQLVTINGATTVNNITANELNITAPITLISGTQFTYNSTGTANANGAGGGATVTYTTPPAPVQFDIDASLKNATDNQFYYSNIPISAIGGLINSSSEGGSLKLTILQAGV